MAEPARTPLRQTACLVALNVNSMNVKQLRKALKERGLSKAGFKPALAKRLKAVMNSSLAAKVPIPSS